MSHDINLTLASPILSCCLPIGIYFNKTTTFTSLASLLGLFKPCILHKVTIMANYSIRHSFILSQCTNPILCLTCMTP